MHVFCLEWKSEIFKVGCAYKLVRATFVQCCGRRFGVIMFAVVVAAAKGISKKMRRSVPSVAVLGDPGGGLDWGSRLHRRVEIVGDSSLVVSWVNRQAAVVDAVANALVESFLGCIRLSAFDGLFLFRADIANPARHVNREFNVEADARANAFIDGESAAYEALM